MDIKDKVDKPPSQRKNTKRKPRPHVLTHLSELSDRDSLYEDIRVWSRQSRSDLDKIGIRYLSLEEIKTLQEEKRKIDLSHIYYYSKHDLEKFGIIYEPLTYEKYSKYSESLKKLVHKSHIAVFTDQSDSENDCKDSSVVESLEWDHDFDKGTNTDDWDDLEKVDSNDKTDENNQVLMPYIPGTSNENQNEVTNNPTLHFNFPKPAIPLQNYTDTGLFRQDYLSGGDSAALVPSIGNQNEVTNNPTLHFNFPTANKPAIPLSHYTNTGLFRQGNLSGGDPTALVPSIENQLEFFNSSFNIPTANKPAIPLPNNNNTGSESMTLVPSIGNQIELTNNPSFNFPAANKPIIPLPNNNNTGSESMTLVPSSGNQIEVTNNPIDQNNQELTPYFPGAVAPSSENQNEVTNNPSRLSFNYPIFANKPTLPTQLFPMNTDNQLVPGPNFNPNTNTYVKDINFSEDYTPDQNNIFAQGDQCDDESCSDAASQIDSEPIPVSNKSNFDLHLIEENSKSDTKNFTKQNSDRSTSFNNAEEKNPRCFVKEFTSLDQLKIPLHSNIKSFLQLRNYIKTMDRKNSMMHYANNHPEKTVFIRKHPYQRDTFLMNHPIWSFSKNVQKLLPFAINDSIYSLKHGKNFSLTSFENAKLYKLLEKHKTIKLEK